MRKLAVLVIVVLLLAIFVLPALADPGTPLEGPNPPTDGGGQSWEPPTDQCNAGHGAFQWFADPSKHFTRGQPPYFGDNELGSARGGATGANNSGYSAYCNG